MTALPSTQAAPPPPLPRRPSLGRRLATALYRRPRLSLALLTVLVLGVMLVTLLLR